MITVNLYLKAFAPEFGEAHVICDWISSPRIW